MGLVERLFMFSIRHPLIALAILFAVTAGTSFGLPRVHIDTSYDSLIDSSNPETDYYNSVVGAFRSDYAALIFLDAEDLFTRDRLQQVERLTDALESLDRVAEVRGLFRTGHIQGRDGLLDVRPVMETTPDTEAGIAEALERARHNPFVAGNILSADGKATTVTVVFESGWNDDRFATATYDKIETLLRPLRTDFHAAFQLGPSRAMVVGREAIIRDMVYLGLLAVVILVGTLALFLRTWILIVLPLVTAGVSLYWTLGLLGLLGVPLEMMAAALPAMVVVVGSAEDAHMLAAYQEGLHAGARDRREAIAFMASHVGFPSILTAATTFAGFGVSGITVVEMMRNSAIALSLGMAVNFIATVLILPFILLKFGPLSFSNPRAKWSIPRFVHEFATQAIALSVRHGRAASWGAIGASFFCVGVGYSLQPSNDPVSLLGVRHPMIQDIQTLNSRMAGAQLLYVIVEGSAPGTFREPGMLDRLAQIEKAITESGRFDTAVSLADHISFINRELNGGRPEMYRIPTLRDQIEQYLLLFSRSDLKSFVTADLRRANILVRYKTFNSAKVGRDVAAILDKIKTIAGPELSVHVTSKSILLSQAGQNMVYSNLLSLILLILAVGAMIAFAYRSIRLGLIALVPNVLPASAIFVAMALFGIPLDPGTSLAADVALGISLDDTIHFMHAFRRRFAEGDDINRATTLAVHDQALPITAVTLALTLCFASLIFSSFAAASNFGLLCAAAIAFSQPCELIITPALLRQFGARRRVAARRDLS
jgi:predicted RND superfamily exporter protein